MKIHKGGERTTEKSNNSQSSREELGEFTVPKEERTKINDLSLVFRKLGEEEYIKPRASRRKEIQSMSLEIKEIKPKVGSFTKKLLNSRNC